MTFSEIASIAGRGGLFHILKPTRSGVIVETMDEQPKKAGNRSQPAGIGAQRSVYLHHRRRGVPFPWKT